MVKYVMPEDEEECVFREYLRSSEMLMIQC